MEATTLFLLLLLPPADTAGDTAAGIQASLRRELGDVSMAIAPDTLVTPSMWQGEKAQMRARFVVRITWTSPQRVKVEMLAGADSTSKGYREGRDLTFDPEDGKSERGRAVGLVIAELLRSSPTSAWADGKRAGPPALLSPSRLELGGLFTTEQPDSGMWAYGPALTYGFGLSEAFQIRAAAMALFGSRDQYKEMGATVGANWDFLRLAQNRYALGVGLVAGCMYESASFTIRSGEYSTTVTPSKSSAAVGATLRARVALWRTLRLVAEGGLGLLSGRLSVPPIVHVDDGRTVTVTSPVSYSRWRPGFAVGLELAL